jgi:hypothetical protein
LRAHRRRPGYQTRDGGLIRNTLNTLAQDVIRRAESFLQADAFVHNLEQAVIRNDDQGIGISFNFAMPDSAEVWRAVTFKGKRAGNHANG